MLSLHADNVILRKVLLNIFECVKGTIIDVCSLFGGETASATADAYLSVL